MSLYRETVSTEQAPKAIGPYSQAVKAGGFVFISGQLGFDPSTGAFVSSSVSEQTRQVLENLTAILLASGSSLRDVVSCTVYLKDMNDFASMNEVYASFFQENPPSRAAVEVSRLPKDGLVEISCIAIVP